jgi:hypothetical protein
MLAGVLSLIMHGTAVAQSPAAVPAGCTYATCALRVEPRFWATHLVRGADGESVGRIGGFGGDVGVLLAGPDSAAANARRYVTDSRRSGTLGVLGLIAGVVFYSRINSRTEDPDPATVTAGVTSLALGIAAIPFSTRASRSLSRAVWWYNAALPR